MIQLRCLSGGKPGDEYTFTRLPVQIGRSGASDLALEAPGVFDQHCEILWSTPNTLLVRAHPGALLRLNGDEVREAPLRNGDLLSLGGLTLRFGLTPVRQRSLLLREALIWLALGAICLSQIVLIYQLLR